MNAFDPTDPVRYVGPGDYDDAAPAFRHYDAERIVLGKTMREQLRVAVCYWHTFCWFGADVFGAPTFARPWGATAEGLGAARRKADAAFAFFAKLGVPYYCFHDIDVAPEGASLREYTNNLRAMTDVLGDLQDKTGVRLLWGTANLFSHPRYAAGAATNPDPEVFACAATQVARAMETTHRLGGANYVLWGGREGYDTLLNTDLARERQQLGRFMQMAVEHKHRIGFAGPLLIEPKPHEPTKHQYDRDVATVHGFLQQFGLERDIKVNIECNHATLAGSSFHHEVAQAIALGVFGSVDANRGDPQNGWDTDQFPNSVEEMTLAMYEILKGGGMGAGGFNFDAKLRRQSVDPVDLLHGHVGAMDVLALALTKAARLVEENVLGDFKARRYAGWDGATGRAILDGEQTLAGLADWATDRGLAPVPSSGRQEWLEAQVNRVLFS